MPYERRRLCRIESLGAMFAFWAVMGVMVNSMLDYFRPQVSISEKPFC
ncbi:MAG: hypothetical protein O8C63_02185 [Candidatus Methanoperedens sp.]|nr:hypothetical protein [Candidatus Methanoperedens sp.]